LSQKRPNRPPRTPTLGLVLAWGLCSVSTVTAAPYVPADSALVARTEWNAVRLAMGKGDQAAALAGVRRAHAAWPGQWFYAYALASLAAESGETATVESALTDLAALGAGPDLAQDTTLVSLAAHDPAVGAALARVAQNRVPLAGGKTAFEFAARDSDFYPEGIAYDAKSGRLFVASVRHRKVAVIDRARAKGERDFVAEPKSGDVDGLFAALAVAVDRPRGRLWVPRP